MKVVKITETTAPRLVNGTLPDIDTDFTGKNRPVIKQYMEDRFGAKHVCSVGTLSSIKLKGGIKDMDRQFNNDFEKVNLITSIVGVKDVTMLDLYKRAALEPKVKQYIKEESDIFYHLSTFLGQKKQQGIHACAMIVFPEIMDGERWTPLRTVGGNLVSQWDGNEMDDAGFLKEDILGLDQLDKFTDILALIKKNGKEVPDIYNLPHDQEVYRYFSNGWNGDVFQIGTEGMSNYTRELKPQTLDDLIAIVALYRPAAMENHYHEIYVKCKNEGRAPTFLWGTEEITKDTFGLLIYQEQVMQVCQQLGNLSMKDADDVRRAMGKKKLSVLAAWREKVQEGFLKNGCLQKDFEKIWGAMLEFAKYGFNKSHAAAYGLTAYVGQYLKVHHPLEFWTVALDYASETQKLTFMSEMAQAKKIVVMPPDINASQEVMTFDEESQNIFWGVNSIKGIGLETAIQVIEERRKHGAYTSLTQFIERHTFKNSKVKKQTYEALISSGVFDKMCGIHEEKQRLNLIKRFRIYKNVKIAKPERDAYTIGTLDENWWWLLKQKELTGLAFIDYQTIAETVGIERAFCTPIEYNQKQMKGIHRAFGGYVVTCKVGSSKKGSYARLVVEHNYKLFKVIIWAEGYSVFEEQLKDCEGSLMVFTGDLRHEAKWTKGNQFTIGEESVLKVLK